MSPQFEASGEFGRNGRNPIRRTNKHAISPKNRPTHPGHRATQRRRHAADFDEASLEIRHALRAC
jgi:hypothetical protein